MISELTGRTIAEIKRHLLGKESTVSAATIEQLRADKRVALHRLAGRLERRNMVLLERKRRMAKLCRLDRRLWRQGVLRLAGVDEAGVGPLAGPVVAAAVVFEPGTVIKGVDDSKRLDPAQRFGLESKIRERATGIGIGAADVAEIDRINIYNASLLAMERAVRALPVRPEKLLVDARELKELLIEQEAVPKGDQNSFSIAAASILAKTCRDRLMDRLGQDYPGYGLAQHKGYATAAHLDAIRRSGPCEIHRQSFPCLKEVGGRCSADFYRFRSAIRRASGVAALTRTKQAVSHEATGLNSTERRKLLVLAARRLRKLSGEGS